MMLDWVKTGEPRERSETWADSAMIATTISLTQQKPCRNIISRVKWQRAFREEATSLFCRLPKYFTLPFCNNAYSKFVQSELMHCLCRDTGEHHTGYRCHSDRLCIPPLCNSSRIMTTSRGCPVPPAPLWQIDHWRGGERDRASPLLCTGRGSLKQRQWDLWPLPFSPFKLTPFNTRLSSAHTCPVHISSSGQNH